MQAEVDPLAHFNANWRNNQLDMALNQPSKIFDDGGKAFTDPMCELTNKYADVFTKPCKTVV